MGPAGVADTHPLDVLRKPPMSDGPMHSIAVSRPAAHRDAAAVSFTDYLRELPAGRVLERFEEAGERGRRILSVSALDRIAEEFARPDNLIRALDSLSPQAREACALAYLFMADGIEASDTAGVDEELLGSFLAYAVRDRDGRLFYRGFAEFEQVLRPHLAAVLARRCAHEHRTSPRWSAPTQVLNDMILTCVLQIQQRLPTTKAGTLAKAAYSTARALLHFASPVWRRELHHTVSLFVHIGRRLELLRDGDDTSVIDQQELRAWLLQGVSRCYSDVVSLCVDEHPVWHWPLAQAAFSAAEGGASKHRWFGLAALGDSRRPQAEAAIRIGEALGLFAVERGDGDLLFAGAHEQSHAAAFERGWEEQITVLPDFSAVISQDSSPQVLYEFSDLGGIENLDQVYRGRMCREAIGNALHRGTSENALMERLERWRAPANVTATVREWAREFSRLSIPEERVILVGDPELFELLSGLEQLRALVVAVPGSRAFRIVRGREDEVAKTLSSMGFDTRAPKLPQPEGAARNRGGIDEAPERPGKRRSHELVTPSPPPAQSRRRSNGGGKSGAELKQLPPGEMDHVIDYAIIMEHRLRFEYEGSPWVKQGEYMVRPVSHTSGPDGVLEGDDTRTGTRKRFVRARITAIGVVEE